MGLFCVSMCVWGIGVLGTRIFQNRTISWKQLQIAIVEKLDKPL